MFRQNVDVCVTVIAVDESDFASSCEDHESSIDGRPRTKFRKRCSCTARVLRQLDVTNFANLENSRASDKRFGQKGSHRQQAKTGEPVSKLHVW